MNSKVGVWVDHRKAIVVHVSDSGEETIHVQSGAESQLRRSSDQTTGSFEPLQVPSDDTRQRKYKAELNTFYDEVISHLINSKSIFICGPGEARKELKSRMDAKHSVTDKVVLEAADSMTDAQVVATIRKHFQVAER
jgi:stalled ribosome rescue protein Dom34